MPHSNNGSSSPFHGGNVGSAPTCGTTYKCQFCNRETDSRQSHNAHQRHCKLARQGQTWFTAASDEVRLKVALSGIAKRRPLPSCLRCGENVNGHRQKYCSHKCSRAAQVSQNKSEITKLNIGKAVRSFHVKNGTALGVATCVICSTVFTKRNKRSKTCSRRCGARLGGFSNRGKTHAGCATMGGFREGSGHSKSGYYRGIYCNSTYELIFVAFHLERNLDIKRSKTVLLYEFEERLRRYHPDFEVNCVTYEVKGFWTKQSEAKHVQHPQVVIVDKGEIRKMQDQCSLRGLSQNQLVARYDP